MSPISAVADTELLVAQDISADLLEDLAEDDELLVEEISIDGMCGVY